MDPSPFANHRYINFKGGGLLHTSANGGDGDVRGDGGSDVIVVMIVIMAMIKVKMVVMMIAVMMPKL